MKRFTSTLLTISTILISSTSLVSASPTNESGSVQNTTQNTYITGDRNTSYQTSEQVNRVDRRNSTDATDISVQEAKQDCDVLGKDNVCDQYIRQSNRVNDSNSINNRNDHNSNSRRR